MYWRCPSDKRPPRQPALSTWVQPFSFHSAAKSLTFLPLPSSSISSTTTSSTIPELTADGVLIKSSRNRTVSKQCSTCQLSNCWALLQPLCLAREERMMGREDKKKEWSRHIEGTNQDSDKKKKVKQKNQKKEKQETEGNERVWRGRAAYTHTPIAAGARKAQLVEVQEGHGEEGGWEWLVEAVLGWSRPAGAVLGLQPPGYGLRAQSLSPRLALWSPLLTQGQCSPLSKS